MRLRKFTLLLLGLFVLSVTTHVSSAYAGCDTSDCIDSDSDSGSESDSGGK